MFGQEELDRLALKKQALLLESDLNRLGLQAELLSLRSAAVWTNAVTRLPRTLTPLLLILAPLAGFLLVRRARRSDSWLSRAANAAKWIGPLYSLWKGFRASRREAEAGEPTA